MEETKDQPSSAMPFRLPSLVEEIKPEDPMRPEAVNGRYRLPHPETGKPQSWQRVTNFTKLSEDTFKLEQWKQRNVIKGLALMAEADDKLLAEVATLDVRGDKLRMDRIVEATFKAADTYAMSDEGTALHKSSEIVDYAGGDLNVAPERHQVKMALYISALREGGLTVVPELIERVTASVRYGVVGKFDRVLMMPDGSHVLADLKTGDSLEYSMPSIAAQLDCYRDGINSAGIWDGRRYDTSIKVRDDIGIVIHLPSTRNEVHLIEVDLEAGRQINAVNLAVRDIRRIKGDSLSRTFRPEKYQSDMNGVWMDQMNAAADRDALLAVVRDARDAKQWNATLSNYARNLSDALNRMGS